MNRYGVRMKEKNIAKMKLIGKKIVMILMIVSLSLSTVSWQNFSSIFAAVATYGRTDNGVWAYKILNASSRTVSIRPSRLGEMEYSKMEIPANIEIQGDTYTVTDIAPYAYSQCLCPDCLKANKMSLSTAWEDESGNYETEAADVRIDELVVPSTVTKIGSNAFEYTSLGSITFEKTSNLEIIGDSAFYECTLKTIEIPASVTTIQSSAFYWSLIETVTFEEGSKLEKIAEYTFEESNLKKITLPESITKIEEAAFLACKLETITIPASVTTIAGYAFEVNKKLKEVNFAEDGALKTIKIGAFMECALTEVVIPASVTTIGICAFGNNSDLNTVTLQTSSNIEKLNANAFAQIKEFAYDEDEIKAKNCEKNTSVTQVNVENYDVYRWIANEDLFSASAKVHSANTRVFVEERKDENIKDNVAMKGDNQATIHLDDYVSAEQGHHFEGSKFDYSNTLNLNQSSTGDIEGTDFVSHGYPYVVIKAKQEANKYELVYDANGGDTLAESTKCQYDEPITITSNIPTRMGYEFKGWSKSASGEGKIYQPGEMVYENFTDKDGASVTLYAVWEEITKKVTIHFSTPKKKSSDSVFEIIIVRDGKKIQQHDISSTEVGEKKIVISGAKLGETYTITCTNYEKSNGKKKYYQTTTKEVTIE